MLDPNYDPFTELENCKAAISDLGKAIDAIVAATNAQAAHIQTIDKKIEFQVKRLDTLVRLLEEKTDGQT